GPIAKLGFFKKMFKIFQDLVIFTFSFRVRTRAQDELCTSQFELQHHFLTQQSIPNTILAL
ncbi:MAG: hypothetical protein VXY27_03270, partial [Thermoproteota archaeon]|nr:hypothetical protein [Thermoproteota archaeon]